MSDNARPFTQTYLDGMNTYTSDLLMQNSDTTLILNGYFSKVGVLRNRGGAIYKGNNVGTTDVLGIGSLYTGLTDGAGGYKKWLYQVSTLTGVTAIRKYNTTTHVWDSLQALGTNLVAAEDYEFTNFLNYSFVVSPSTVPRTINGSDGNTVSITANLLNSPNYAAHIETFFNRVYMGDCTQGSFRYPSRVYFSSLPYGIVTTVMGDQNGVTTEFEVADNRYLNGVTVDIRSVDGVVIAQNKTITAVLGRTGVQIQNIGGLNLYSGDNIWIAGTYEAANQIVWDPIEDYFSCGENDGEGINRLARLGDYLYIFKPGSVWRWSGTNLLNLSADAKGTGAISGKSVAKANTSLIFLSQLGFYQINAGGQMQNISGKITDIIDNIDWSTASQATGWADRENYYCYIPTVHTLNADDSNKRTLSNVTFVYNLRQLSWSLFTGFKATCATNFLENGRVNYYIGSSSGKVLQVFSGYKDQTGTSTYTDIPFEIETKDYYIGTPDQYIQFDSLFAIVDVGGGMSAQFSIDGGAFQDFARQPEGVDDPQKLRFPDNSYGRKIKIKFKLNSQNLAKIKGFILYFREKEPEFYKN